MAVVKAGDAEQRGSTRGSRCGFDQVLLLAADRGLTDRRCSCDQGTPWGAIAGDGLEFGRGGRKPEVVQEADGGVESVMVPTM